MKTTILATLMAAAITAGAIAEEKPQRERGERPQRGERGERPEGGERPKRPERGERPEGGERGERPGPGAMFDMLDKNKDGVLTLEEFLNNPRVERADDQVAAKAAASRRFNAMDKNEDGRVTKEEFEAYMAETREKMRERLQERGGERGERRGGEGRQRPQRPATD